MSRTVGVDQGEGVVRIHAKGPRSKDSGSHGPNQAAT